MRNFDRFYLDAYDSETEFGGFAGMLLETSNSGISRLYQFDFFERNSLQVINSKNDAGLATNGFEKEKLIGRMSEITIEKSVDFIIEKLAKNYAQSTYIFMRLLGKGASCQCWENDNGYLIHFPKANFTMEGTKDKYDFEFKDDENSKLYYFCANIEDYYAQEKIEKGNYKQITKDAISIYFIWQEFIPDMWGLDFD